MIARTPVYTLAVTLLASAPAPGRAFAQAPVITEAGDPSVRSDTIYKLAVKPAEYPDRATMLLLDDGVVRLEADGRATRTFRQVTQVLTEDALDGLREQQLSYAPGHQRLRLNWARVVKPDGTVLSDKPTHVQESDVPANMGNPVYSDGKVLRFSLTGVEPGTLVDMSYTIEELKPYLEGDFLEWWQVTDGSPIVRSRYVLDLPASVAPNIYERNAARIRKVTHASGRTIYTWAANDVPYVKPEPFAADSNDILMRLAVGAPGRWDRIAGWYAANARDRYQLSPALARKVREVVAGAKTRDDSVRAVHRWVAQDIRYVSLALGAGRYQPRTPDSVVTTGFGDCKDKATLFIAALRELGVAAHPVLLHSGGYVVRTLPSYKQFDHAIAAVPVPGGRGYQFTDLTAATLPYGVLPASYQGSLGLVVLPDGRGDLVTFPQNAVADNVDSTRVVGTLDTAGYFDGRYMESVRGTPAEVVRRLFETPLDSARRADLAKAIARQYFENATGDSLVAFAGKDLRAEPRVSVRIRRGRAAQPSGATMILAVRPGAGAAAKSMADDLAEAPKRRFPIDASRVFGTATVTSEVEIMLPDGWRAQLPPNVHGAGTFGSYDAEYAQQGNRLRIVRRVAGAKGVYGPERLPDLVAWFRAIGKDDAKYIVLERARQ